VQVGGIGPRVIVTDDGFELTDKRISDHGQILAVFLMRIQYSEFRRQNSEVETTGVISRARTPAWAERCPLWVGTTF
jgi:hypothetical protein